MQALDFSNPQAYKETKPQEVEIGSGSGEVSEVVGRWFGQAVLHSFTFWGRFGGSATSFSRLFQLSWAPVLESFFKFRLAFLRITERLFCVCF